ncbi:dTDP-4-dehydrorhamnose reductase [Ensifer sp. Root423]|uniref:dTDP-4-dehydrorhamnose reductase n=1 Tax=Ensifer sp. Root423 TaxID=1736534 RepID=UPI0009EB5FAD|nr:dTDP-4-dehydrorhamnose reductase [Ensifer sp. Root423]
MSKLRILVTGGSGQVGTELLRNEWTSDVEIVAPTRQEFDLCDFDRLERYVTEGDFAAVVNSGAYTAVDRAEDDVLMAWKINALAPAALAAATKRCGIPIIHVSTDYVFDGAKDGVYVENDPVAPLGVYGASKEAGEQAVRTGNPKHIILRTAWVFGATGSNFVKTMIRLGREKPTLRVVDDQLGSPTAATDIAETLVNVTRQLIDDNSPKTGTFHFVNSGTATWYEFAQEVFQELRRRGEKTPVLEPISSDQYPTRARRPRNSRLSTDKLRRELGTQPREWTAALRQIIGSL